jgi:hypothetical protein
MGMLLDDPDGIGNLSSDEYWKKQLANDRILLVQIDKAINTLNASLVTNNGIAEYTIDTGQDKQIVKRSDLGTLYTWRKNLISEIAQLERSLGGSGGCRIIPGF